MSIDKDGVYDLVRKINRKKDELKAVIETSDKIQDHVQTVKEAQEALKSVIEADVEAFGLIEEIKALNKELGQATKTVSKTLAAQGYEAKPAQVKAFITKKVKDEEAIDKVIQTGSKFNVLRGIL